MSVLVVVAEEHLSVRVDRRSAARRSGFISGAEHKGSLAESTEMPRYKK
jgi:hypothetical protein